MKLVISLAGILVFGLALPNGGQTQEILSFPSEACPTSAQDCVNQLCEAGDEVEKYLLLEPGTYRLGPTVIPDLPPGFPIIQVNNNLFLNCNHLHVLGAGRGRTIIDGTDSLNIGVPLIQTGTNPFDLRVIDSIEVADLTLNCGTNCANGIEGYGVDGLHVHHVDISGFEVAVFPRTSTDVLVHNIRCEGKGPGAISLCIRLGGGGGDPSRILQKGIEIFNNQAFNASIGIDVLAAEEVVVIGNRLSGPLDLGMRFRGVLDLRVLLNKVSGVASDFLTDPAALGDWDTSSGIHVRTVKDAAILLNSVCGVEGASALRFADSFEPSGDPGAPRPSTEFLLVPDLFTVGNEDVNVSLNKFSGYDPDICIEEILDPGIAEDGFCFDPENADSGGNKFFLNRSDPEGNCR